MWKIALSAALLASSVWVTAANAQEPVAPWQLNSFIGQNLFGLGHMNLGVVAAADPQTGVVGVVGRHGDYFLVSSDALLKDGLNLSVPGLTPGEVRVASEETLSNTPRRVLLPEVRVLEPAG